MNQGLLGRRPASRTAVRQILRERGLRVTEPRIAVIEALTQLQGHPTADEVAAAVSSAGVHLATVYRTLETLTAAKVLTHVHLDSGVTAYHLADEHLHARCHSCGSVVDLPADLLDDVAQRMHDLAGFQLEAGHIALSGTCARCVHNRDEPGGHAH